MTKYGIIAVSILTVMPHSHASIVSQNKQSLFYPSNNYINARTATQFTIGLLANGFSQNNFKHKLIANGIGLTCSLAVHAFFNRKVDQTEYTGTLSPAEEQKTTFTSALKDNLKSSVISYGLGASIGIGMQALFEKIKQKEKNIIVKFILEHDCYSICDLCNVPCSDRKQMYMGQQSSISKLLFINTTKKTERGNPFIATKAWDAYIQEDLIKIGANTISETYGERTAIYSSSFDAWKNFIVGSLQAKVFSISKDELTGSITSITLEKLEHNYTLVEEAIKKLKDAVL